MTEMTKERFCDDHLHGCSDPFDPSGQTWLVEESSDAGKATAFNVYISSLVLMSSCFAVFHTSVVCRRLRRVVDIGNPVTVLHSSGSINVSTWSCLGDFGHNHHGHQAALADHP